MRICVTTHKPLSAHVHCQVWESLWQTDKRERERDIKFTYNRDSSRHVAYLSKQNKQRQSTNQVTHSQTNRKRLNKEGAWFWVKKIEIERANNNWYEKRRQKLESLIAY